MIFKKTLRTLIHKYFYNTVFTFLAISCFQNLTAQTTELNTGWKCQQAAKVRSGLTGKELSAPGSATDGWINATVPGTVQTSLLQNKQIPDPFYGMNNERIPDIYNVGRDYYTYWFVTDFQCPKSTDGSQVWLQFRGVNYGFKLYINGQEVNKDTARGMFLRHTFNITPFIAADGANRIAVLVMPPDPVGNPNGGQGGDGTIARNVSNQYVAGWDWIQPIRDRNTGIWDKVLLTYTGEAAIKDPHVVTLVKGVRDPGSKKQADAVLKVSATLRNTGAKPIVGTLYYVWEKDTVKKKVNLPAGSDLNMSLPDHTIHDPKLWWPNGYGSQALQHISLRLKDNKSKEQDAQDVQFGIREIAGLWNKHTRSREVRVNGRPIFIRGGNWITSDAMMRFTDARYDAEVRMHRDMNLNLIRVWGGSLTERPEFYDACDKYGILVMQDFWVSGDCNGRWYDTFKKDDTLARRRYPDDHRLFINSVADQVAMLRNHPSLAIWCGGNETEPPQDILKAMRDSILPRMDGTRIFFSYSNADSMSFQSHDGPYGIQDPDSFYIRRSYPFNSEIGSVGVGELTSLQRFLPAADTLIPVYNSHSHSWDIDSVWAYHKYKSYDSSMEAYGHPTSLKDFCRKAQLVNYVQYRALEEGFAIHAWDWYTGVINWKTQNPWTAMLGQMYDYYLEPNACMFGTKEGARNRHILYDPVQKAVKITNTDPSTSTTNAYQIQVLDTKGGMLFEQSGFCKTGENKTVTVFDKGAKFDSLSRPHGSFVNLRLADSAFGFPVDENLYWLPDATGKYSGLQTMNPARIRTAMKILEPGLAELTIQNPSANPVAFFMHLSVVSSTTLEPVLPAFFSDNYVSVLPGKQKRVLVEYKATTGKEPWICIEGWNVEKQYAGTSSATK